MNKVTFSSLFLILTIIGCQKRLDKFASDLDETLGAKGKTTNTNRTITGQGAFIDFDVRGTYTTNGNKTFEYDKTAAANYFTHSEGVVSGEPVYQKLSGPSGESTVTSKVATYPNPLPSEYWVYTNSSAPPATPTKDSIVYTSSSCIPVAPGAGSAPAKDNTQFTNVIENNACTFLNGGTLQGTTYTKVASPTAANCNTITKLYYKLVLQPGKDKLVDATQTGWYKDVTTVNGNYTYSFSYSITANDATKIVAPITNWTEVSFSLGDGPTIPVAAFISRLQVTSQQNADGTIDFTTTKYTFNLESQVTDPNTGLTTWQSNISGIKIEVLDAQGNVINGSDGNPLVVNTPPHYVESNYNPATPLVLPQKGETGSVDFKYAALAASNLTSGTSIGLYDFNKNGVIDSADMKDAREILNTDGFANNQDGGLPLGKALQKARMPAQPIQFPGTLVGDYQIRISANVSGLASSTTQTITHTQKINIIANCNNVQ